MPFPGNRVIGDFNFVSPWAASRGHLSPAAGMVRDVARYVPLLRNVSFR